MEDLHTLRKLDEGLWTASRKLKVFGVSFGTRMTLIELRPGELAVVSPFAPEKQLLAEIQKIGTVKVLIAPNFFHHLFVHKWPGIETITLVYATKLKGKVDDRLSGFRESIALNPESLARVENLLRDGVEIKKVPGAPLLDEYQVLHRKTRTLVGTDFFLNFPHADQSFLEKLLDKAYGISRGSACQSRLLRFAIKDKDEFSQYLRSLIELDLKRIIVAHGAIVTTPRQTIEKILEDYYS